MTVEFDLDGDFQNGPWSDPRFEYRGVDYTVGKFTVIPSSRRDEIYWSFDKDFPGADRDTLRLHVCGDTFDLTDAEPEGFGDYSWSTFLEFLWSPGITVSLALSAELSDNAMLRGLELVDPDGFAIGLSPPFAFHETRLTAQVANAVPRVTVLPTTGDRLATVRYRDGDGNALADADTGADGHQVDLEVGTTTIRIVVTAEDGTVRTYTVEATRAPQSDADATLRALELSEGVLSPAFDPVVTGYTATVRDSVSQITVTAAARDSTATVEFLDADNNALADLDTQAPSREVGLAVGENTIQVAVTAGDGTTTSIYAVVVIRTAQSDTDATLHSLTVETLDGRPVALSPAFASGTSDYVVTLPPSVGMVRVTAVATDSAATVERRYDDPDNTDYIPFCGRLGGRSGRCFRHPAAGDGRGRHDHDDLHVDRELPPGLRLRDSGPDGPERGLERDPDGGCRFWRTGVRVRQRR